MSADAFFNGLVRDAERRRRKEQALPGEQHVVQMVSGVARCDCPQCGHGMRIAMFVRPYVAHCWSCGDLVTVVDNTIGGTTPA